MRITRALSVETITEGLKISMEYVCIYFNEKQEGLVIYRMKIADYV